MFINSRKPVATIGLTLALAASAVLLPSTATFAAKSKAAPKTKTKTSTAKYCTAAKAWLAFENETLATGPYDAAYAQRTGDLVLPLVKLAPKAQAPSTARFVDTLVGSRWELARQKPIVSESDESFLQERANEWQGSDSEARDAVGAYTLKTCKIDVLQPFRDLAAGFE